MSASLRLRTRPRLPINAAPPRGREPEKPCKRAIELCASQVGIRKSATAERGATEIGSTQDRATKAHALENGSTQVHTRKVRLAKINVNEVVPAGGGLRQVRGAKRDPANLRA